MLHLAVLRNSCIEGLNGKTFDDSLMNQILVSSSFKHRRYISELILDAAWFEWERNDIIEVVAACGFRWYGKQGVCGMCR